MNNTPTNIIMAEIAKITLDRGCTDDYHHSQSKTTQISCVARIAASSQTLAILRLRFGALWEMETRRRNRNEISPNTTVTRRVDSPNPQTEVPSRVSELEDSVPAWIITSDTRLVNCPTIRIGADESAFGLVHLCNRALFLVLTPDLLS